MTPVDDAHEDRLLTFVHTFSRFRPVIEPRFRSRYSDMVETLEGTGKGNGQPKVTRVDRSSEVISRDQYLLVVMDPARQRE